MAFRLCSTGLLFAIGMAITGGGGLFPLNPIAQRDQPTIAFGFGIEVSGGDVGFGGVGGLGGLGGVGGFGGFGGFGVVREHCGITLRVSITVPFSRSSTVTMVGVGGTANPQGSLKGVI